MIPKETMDNTTIEEKAKELYPDETGTFLEMPNQSKVILQRKAFIAGASLSTPCEEQPEEGYWKKRCEAAEAVIHLFSKYFITPK